MWALRRVSSPFKFQRGGFRVLTPRVASANPHALPGCLEGNDARSEPSSGRRDYHHSSGARLEIALWRRGLSSQAGAKSGESDNDSEEDLFSELEVPPTRSVDQNEDDLVSEIEVPPTRAVDQNEDDLVSEPELSDFEENDVEEEASEDVVIADGKKTLAKGSPPDLFKAVIANAGSSIQPALEKWVEQGKEFRKEDVLQTTHHLRRRRMYGRALQLLEWLESNNKLESSDRDYAARLDLIAKVRGLQKAESFLQKVPKSFKSEVLYRTMLANCVATSNLRKAEEIFNRMKDLGFPLSSFACNQLLLLYKRLDKKKIADVLLLMEKENVKPSAFTYRLLIDAKGQSNDINGMEQIVESMKADGIESDIRTQAIMAKHYISAGILEKAEALLKEMEGEDITEQRWACQDLLPLYALLGKADEVSRIWKVCESKPRIEECVAAVKAWGKLKNVDEAEAVFNKMASTWKKLSSRQYSSLLVVYAENNLLSKGKRLVKRMSEDGVRIGPQTWNALVKLYVDAGEVEKADSMLQRAVQQGQLKPMYISYMAILDQYAKRGDVHNAEKIFLRMRQSGYSARARQFSALLQTYVNAKAPAYGIRERMMADNIFPNKAMATQLVLVDPFRRTPVSDLLD